jgi:hypothetical protein
MANAPDLLCQEGWEELNPRMHSSSLASYDYKTDFLLSSLQGGSFMHELIHFFDHVGTPYGYFLDRVTGMVNAAYRQLLAHFNADTAPNMRVPLARLLGDLDELGTILRAGCKEGYKISQCLDYLVVFSVFFRGIVALERSLEGCGRPGIFSIDGETAVSGLNLFEALERDGLSALPEDIWELTKIRIDNKEWSISVPNVPRLVIEGEQDEIPLGAATLLEGRAFFLERGLSDPGPGDPLPKLVARKGRLYYTAVALLANECLKNGFERYDEITDTYLALADLALYTPIGNPYGCFRIESNWDEVHPGVRFQTLIGILKDIGPFRRAYEMDIFDYQDRYCSMLGWFSPRKFLQTGAQLGGGYRSRRHRDACKLKLEYPRLFINSNLEYLPIPSDEELSSFLAEKYMPFCINTEDPARCGVSKATPEGYLERLGASYLQSLGWSMLMSGKPNERQHLPREFPYSRYLKWTGDGSLQEFLDACLRQHIVFLAL